MKLAIFSKKRQVQEIDANGKVTVRPFFTYLTTLVRKTDGERVTVQVKFREACGAPDPLACPMFIEVARDKMNLSWQKYTSDDGEEPVSGMLQSCPDFLEVELGHHDDQHQETEDEEAVLVFLFHSGFCCS